MQKEETRFVFFEIRNRLLSEICRDFKIKVDEVTFFDFMSENNIGYEGRRCSCYVHKAIPNNMGTPGELGLARWFAEMILYTKIGNKKASDFIMTYADEIDRHTSYYEIEYEHLDPYSLESCLLIEKYYCKDGNKAKLYGFDEKGWVSVWEKNGLTRMENYMPQNYRYPLNIFDPKSNGTRCALSSLLADGFGDRFRGMNRNDSFVRNVAEGTIVAEYQRPDYLKMQPIHYTPASCLTSLEGLVVYPFGNFKSVKKKDLKKFITVNGGKLAAAYTKKVNLVLVGDDVGACFDAAADNYRSCEYMERAVARKWLGSDLIFVSESDFFAKNSWIRNGAV